MQPLLNIGMRAARRAGDLNVRSLSRLDSLKIDTKGRNDFVTDIDRKAEAEIIATVRRGHPDHAFLAEESGRSGESEFVWIIDPLDGTTNFIHGVPLVCVSIGVEYEGRLILGGVYNPISGEMFLAEKGRGARLNGRPIHVSRVPRLEDSLYVTGFPYDRTHPPADYVRFFEAFLTVGQGVRRLGAAALDLAWVAAGRFEGFWEFRLSAWDVAAGALLVEEAGGRITDVRGDRYPHDRPLSTLATNSRVHAGMLKILRTANQTASPSKRLF